MVPAGLYDTGFEHDACGVGFVADLSGRGGHDVVASALRVLCNLEHRGAAGGDPDTGDGAGILTQIPDAFFRAVIGFALPEAGRLCGRPGLPSPPNGTVVTRRHRRLAADEGLTVLGWRDVPSTSTACGAGARAVLPDAGAAVRGGRGGRDAAWTSTGWRSACASGPSTRPASTSPACPPGPSCTRACCPRRRSSRSSPTCPTSGTPPRWPWCTPGSPPTRSRPGRGRTRTGTSRTTARSTPCRATGTGCAPARRCWPPP